MAELVLGVLRLVANIFGVFARVYCRHREDGARVVEQIPVRRVAPVFRLAVGRGGSEGGRAEDYVYFAPVGVVRGRAPGLRVCCAVGFSVGCALGLVD